MTELTITNLAKRYPATQRPALNGLTLSVKSGSMTALLGPSGCGKTTAMKLIAGLIDPTSGDVLFDGRSVLRDPAETRGAVMVFQKPLLFPHLDVAANVGFGLRMRGIPRTKADARVADMLAMVQLSDLGNRRPAALSGGQQQRVALARALIVRPKVLLLDEPLSNLDAHLRVEMRDLIKSLHREMGVTTLFVTHDQAEAAVVADDIALILDGKLAQSGPAESLFQQPSSLAVARFFGLRNVVRGQVQGSQFMSPLGPLHHSAALGAGPAVLVLRPDAIVIGAGAENTLIARLKSRTYMGTQTQLRLQVGTVDLEALVPPDQAARLAIGETLQVHITRAAVWLLSPGDGPTHD
jgi:ABC-type Fe3+/spermidine/putrescine transport system ATPase subunit